jgi:ArsR family transcriptional regulator
MIEQFKALASEARLEMLHWLKRPSEHFPPTHAPNGWADGVCVTHIQQKTGLSPSTTSNHLAILQRAGLVTATRIGQWTYYRRNEAAIADLARLIQTGL